MREPLWLPEDTEAALEYIDYESLTCSGCGQLKSESMDPANARLYEAVPITCYGCGAIAEESRTAVQAKSGGGYADSAFDGLFISVKKKSDIEG